MRGRKPLLRRVASIGGAMIIAAVLAGAKQAFGGTGMLAIEVAVLLLGAALVIALQWIRVPSEMPERETLEA